MHFKKLIALSSLLFFIFIGYLSTSNWLDYNDKNTCLPIPINGRIIEAGNYCLQENYQGNITITASNSKLNLNGHGVSPTKTSDIFGINLTGDYITIENGNIKNFKHGIVTRDSRHILLRNLSVNNSEKIGILLNGSDHILDNIDIMDTGKTTAISEEDKYAVGIQVNANNVAIQNSVIRDTVVPRFAEKNLVGEPVGVLFNEMCRNCQITKSAIINSSDIVNSIAIWTSKNANVNIKNNTLSGFENGILLARDTTAQIFSNSITCQLTNISDESHGIFTYYSKNYEDILINQLSSNTISSCETPFTKRIKN